MARLLIIRSVGLQQLDKTLPAVRAAYPNHEIHVLTHAHAAEAVRSYQDVDHTHIYPYREGFSMFRPFREGGPWDVVIVPVGNLTGAGFFNVFLFAARFKSKTFAWVNLVESIQPFQKLGLLAKGIGQILYYVFALISTIILSPFLFILLPIMCIFLRGKPGENN